MFRLAAPYWLLLLPCVALLAWMIPRAGLWRPLRLACLVILVLYLAKPEWNLTPPGMDLIVLMDRSDSAAEWIEPRREEIERLLEANRGVQDQLRIVDFAAAPMERAPGRPFESPRGETRMRLAVEYALGLRDPARAARMLMVTDGVSTEELGGTASLLSAAGVPMDLRLESRAETGDSGITRVVAPPRVQPGQGVLLEFDAFSAEDEAIPYELLRDGMRIGTGEVTIQRGRGHGRVAFRAEQSGAHRYDVRLLPRQDSRIANNTGTTWIEAVSGPNVLLVTPYPDDPLAGALSRGGIAVDVVNDPSRLHAGDLSSSRLVILNNMPANRLPAAFLDGLPFFVREQGGGLLMAGGAQSFGAGGYFESALDPLLPVSMELREEHRKLAVAMAIVLDRSGSMAASAGGGATKMDLADEGAARAIELLGAMDAVAVYAVDSEAHEVVPFSMIGRDRGKMIDDVRRIGSAGGGIFVYTGLKAAWEALKTSPAGQRHVILFADAADAEEPGDYQRLVGEMASQGVTVSVIGLGQRSDPDANFLVDVAALGKGRIFFNADPGQLPGVFAQETVAIARSAFLKDPVAAVAAGGWTEISPRRIDWLKQVDGYNLSYLRPGASAALISGDEYHAPLVAFWQRGIGRAAAVCFPLSGEYSAAFRQWPSAADFVQTLARWLLPPAAPQGTSLRVKTFGNDVSVELLADDSWTEVFAKTPPVLIVSDGTSGDSHVVPWSHIEPRRLEARVPLQPGKQLRGIVRAGDARWGFGPVAPSVDPEWDSSTDRIDALRAASAASGGRVITDLRQAWHRPPATGYSPLGSWLLLLLAVAFLSDAALTRWRGR